MDGISSCRGIRNAYDERAALAMETKGRGHNPLLGLNIAVLPHNPIGGGRSRRPWSAGWDPVARERDHGQRWRGLVGDDPMPTNVYVREFSSPVWRLAHHGYGQSYALWGISVPASMVWDPSERSSAVCALNRTGAASARP